MKLSVQVINIVKIWEWSWSIQAVLHLLCGINIVAFFPPSPGSYQGGFAKVKLGRHILTGEKVAIKIMNKKDLGVSITEALCRKMQ